MAHRFRFTVEVDAPGDWRIDVVAKWPGGSAFSEETIRIHGVP